MAAYGTLVFLFIAIPMLVEGSALHALEKIDDHTLQETCNKPIEEVREEHGRLVVSLFEFAHRFDKMSETVLDEYMCTPTCPCLDYDYKG